MSSITQISFLAFVSQIQERVKAPSPLERDFTNLDSYPISGNQCMYVLDWSHKRCVYQKGVPAFLGYDPEEFTFEQIVDTYHPDDQERLFLVIREAVKYCTSRNLVGDDFLLQLAYRVRHRDGHYIKVLRQSSVHQVGNNGRMVSNLSLLTDISFMDRTDHVHWDIQAAGLDRDTLQQIIYASTADIFTRREREILKLMSQGLNNNEIARRLHISYHTVATHRKNIYRKSGCNGLQELLDFSYKCGILS